MKTAIIIPTYNESENIEHLIDLIFKNLSDTHVVVVDDNSKDGTSRIVASLAKKNKRVHLISREGKGGRGSAVVAGFTFALKDLDCTHFIEMDADLSHDPSELQTLLKTSKPKTVVLASRYLKGSKILNWPLSRKLASRISNMLIGIVLNNGLRDNTNGYRLYQKDAVEELLKYPFVSKGYILLSESATLLKQTGFKLIEMPTVFVNRRLGKSNTTLTEFTQSFLMLLKIKKSIQAHLAQK